MSLYDRLDLTRPNRRKLKSSLEQDKPIWEKIDLTRPVKPKCKVCRHRIQESWRVCPHCGWLLQNTQTKRHCIWVQVCNLEFYGDKKNMWEEILADAFSKVFSAFRSVNI
ncbi:MAG: peptidase M10A and M12B matrixin and adamalysin, partial [Xenococcus sp. (in: cyanobacteria)]